MKKKLFIGTILPSIAALAVIGSGFSLWIFEKDNTVSKSGTIGINVTNVAKIGTLEVTNTNTTLVLDQETKINSDSDVINLNAKGVHFETGNDSALQKVTYLKDSSQEYYVDYVNGVTDITFTTAIKIPSALASYVTLAGTGSINGKDVTFTSDTTSNTGYTTYTFVIKASEMTSFDASSAVEVFNWNNVTPSYANEPKNLSDYDTMYTALKNITTFDVTYTAVISINE